ncbi:uncharacterized mitochondrial protein AtMg00810-like [Aphidius gifuensis]|uniref:uncharacterized mitochondrial protein AtMg00810-like n=1 Tax=Aphidius gifuensis TaxID=684658 RepID=UPI001CDC2DB1|nr:uncharacterized mitochondrial protein AtMg00810-like [Aphidius gifuensis]
MTQSKYDGCLYICRKNNKLMLLVVYVDDILFSSSDEKWTQEFKVKLNKYFQIKDLGKANYCLGLEIKQNSEEITIGQTEYINDVLERFNMDKCKPVKTPIEKNLQFDHHKGVNEQKLHEGHKYQELIGSLMYLATSTRPDIMFAVNFLSQFNNKNDERHWTAGKRVLRYLQGTKDVVLKYKNNKKPLEGFVDADWGQCTQDRRSYTGYTFILSCGAISAQELARNPVHHAKTKHIDIRFHLIREAVQNKTIDLHYKSEELMADVMTKGLTGPAHYKCIDKFGLTNAGLRGGVGT